MNGFIAVIAFALVGGLAVYVVHAAMGPWAWLGYCAAAFFGLMAGMARLNSV